MTTNTDREVALSETIAELRAMLAAATPGDLGTAERHTKSETVECPACQGDGELDAADYCNFDGVALGVQFYGIGNEFGAHEKLWTATIKALPMLLDAADPTRHRETSTSSLSAENQRLRELLAMPRMFDAFRTTTSSGTEPRYVMTFKFRTMQAMHDADKEWIAFRKEAQEYFGLPESWAEPAALSTPSEVSNPVADNIGGEGKKPRSWYIGQASTGDAVREALEWFSGQHRLSLQHYSPMYGDDDDQSVEWRVHRESGPINDREWEIVGRGKTALDAILAALNHGGSQE